MNKKTPYIAYYYSANVSVTQAQLKAKKSLPQADFSAISAVEQRMDKNGIYGIVQEEKGGEYLEMLSSVTSAPYVLYYQGDISLLGKPCLAIVGPRKISMYAKHILEKLFTELPQYSLTTISGIAAGVDTMCHELSLQYNIPTIAILAGGFDHFLNGTRRDLLERIVQHGGLVISEFKHRFKPTTWSFPQRNRIIAGAAKAVFLPEAHKHEADKKSGSLITADMAIAKKIPVYAPLGDIFQKTSEGTNEYIVAGKISPVNELSSFLEKHFSRTHNGTKKQQSDLTEYEQNIIQLIYKNGEVTIDVILQQIKSTLGDIIVCINILELKGIIYECSPGVYKVK